MPRLLKYASHPNAAKYKGRSIVSTFMGTGFDWSGVRAAVPAGLAIVSRCHAVCSSTIFERRGNHSDKRPRYRTILPSQLIPWALTDFSTGTL